MTDYTYRITPVGGPTPRAVEMNGAALALTGVSAGDAITLTWVPRRFDLGSPVERRARTLKPFWSIRLARVWLDTGFQSWRRRQPPKEGAPVGFYTIERSYDDGDDDVVECPSIGDLGCPEWDDVEPKC